MAVEVEEEEEEVWRRKGTGEGRSGERLLSMSAPSTMLVGEWETGWTGAGRSEFVRGRGEDSISSGEEGVEEVGEAVATVVPSLGMGRCRCRVVSRSMLLRSSSRPSVPLEVDTSFRWERDSPAGSAVASPRTTAAWEGEEGDEGDASTEGDRWTRSGLLCAEGELEGVTGREDDRTPEEDPPASLELSTERCSTTAFQSTCGSRKGSGMLIFRKQ